MKRIVIAAVAAMALLTHAPQARALQCGLPDARPLWFEYAEGSVSFRKHVFGRPGIIAATSGTVVPADLRAAGAQTVYWENKLGSLVGTTTKPADPATIPAAANRLFDKAVASSGCGTPLIGLNELNGPGTTTPWTTTNAQYRANVLTLVRTLAGRGARPFLLLPSTPYTGGEALEWWRQAAEVADLVPEVYFQAPSIMKLGPVLGSRRMRQSYRQAIHNFTEIGVPVSRLGLVIGFQSGPGFGGREGLQPSSSWFEFVKLQTLAAKQVASELTVASVWSWGWGTFNQAGADPDKPAAACVYLWARDQALCDGPAAGAGFDSSLEEGQIALPAGVQCRLDGRVISTAGVVRVAALTGDREIALSALLARLVESERAHVSPGRVLDVERRLVTLRFRGSRTRYLAAVRERGLTSAIARAILADQLRRGDVSRTLQVSSPTQAQIGLFYSGFPFVPVRLVTASPAPSWLGSRRRGFALVPPAPSELLAIPLGRAVSVLTAQGAFSVTPLEQALPLGAVPLALARPAIRAALVAFARADAVDSWSTRLQERALDRLSCIRDELPSPGSIDLSSYLPFLALGP